MGHFLCPLEELHWIFFSWHCTFFRKDSVVTYHIGVKIHQNIVICVCTCVCINYSFGVKVIVNVLALLLLCDVFWAQLPVLSLMYCSTCDLLFTEVCIETPWKPSCLCLSLVSMFVSHKGASWQLRMLTCIKRWITVCVCVCAYVYACALDTQWLKCISVWLLKTILHVCLHCL